MRGIWCSVAVFLAVTLIVDVAAAEGGIETARGLGPPYYLGAAIMSLILVAAHLLAPQLRGLLDEYSPIVASFGGGMTAAYVFLHLLPELDEGHELLGLMIFVIPLVGFVIRYLIERRFRAANEEEASRVSGPFAITLANLMAYNWLIIYGTPESAAEAGWAVTPIVIALLLHLIESDYGFGQKFQKPFDAVGRYLLAGATLCGYASILVFQRTNEDVTDIFTAFLAGSILFNVFRNEIPDAARSRIGWFMSGIAIFAALVGLPRI